MAVSYTHLDVYKRQKLVRGVYASFAQASAVLNNAVTAAARTKPDVAAESLGDPGAAADFIVEVLSNRHGGGRL